MNSKTRNSFLLKLTLCLMTALLLASCATGNYRTLANEEPTGRIQDSDFYKHKVDRTLFY